MNVSRSALLPYSVEQMFNIVTDISAYPQFLNWCGGADIISEEKRDVVAKLSIAYGALNFGFTTRNQMRPNECVTMKLIDGPFSRLSGQWSFQQLDENACKVSLEMDFDFENPLTQKLFGRVFKNVISTQLDAFQKRADELYA